MNWGNKKILVTGGASFIGSHLVEKLVQLGASVRVVDNLSSGKKEHIDENDVEFIEGNLLDPKVSEAATKGMNYVFHLAADHGGRGYIDSHQVECSTNMILDGMVFKAAYEAGCEKVIFSSSGCVYPTSLQMDTEKEVYLYEDMVKPPYEADDLYGWAKLMAELTLKAYYEQKGMKAALCRYFTAYGPRCSENHAVMAMIARAYLKKDPYEVWGDGEQIRNWTYIDDIVEGTILSAEKIDNATALNVGTMERIKVIDCAKGIFNYTNYKARIKLLTDKPTGPLNRVASNQKSKELLGWEPKVKFVDGLHKTIDWYFSSKTKEQAERDLKEKLVGR